MSAWVQRRWTVAATRIDAPILLDIAGLVAFPILRTQGDNTLLGAWTVAVMILAVRWPGSGLGLAAALTAFPQPLRVDHALSIALVAASAIGFAVDLTRYGYQDGAMRQRLAIVVAGVVALAAATFLALLRSAQRLEPEIVVVATRRWIELGAGLAFFVLLLRAFSMGSKRPLVVGLTGISVAVLVSIVDFVAPQFFPSIDMGWLVPGPLVDREAGPFYGPNRLGTVAGIMVIVGAYQALIADRLRWLWAALAAAAGIALLASFSRGALLGLAVAAVTILAIRSRRLSPRYLVAVLVFGAVVVPLIVGARLAGSGASLEQLVASDQARLEAWLAGIGMIQAEPIFGHGFYAFRAIGADFGAPANFGSAHNEIIGLWAENGVLAVAASVGIVGGVIACALDRREDSWAMIAIGALALYVVASSFNIQSVILTVMGPLWLVVAYGIARPIQAGSLELAPPRR